MAAHGWLIRRGDVVTLDGVRRDLDVRIDDGMITDVGSTLSTADAQIIDVHGLIVAPGFVDIHVHGAAGAMCESGDPAQIETISATLAHFGVTGFLATIATLPPEALRAAVRAVADIAGHEPGARILGIHLEGPYLNPLRAGAQAMRLMRPPSMEEFDTLYGLSGGLIRLVTVAPELEGSLPFIEAVRDRGVMVAAGHSDATAGEIELAIAAGVTHVTHLFNAMRPWHHREPGIVGVALTDDRLSVELICDGHHLSEHAVDLALRCKPRDKVVLVSDAVACGVPDGEREIFGTRCVVAAGAIRLKESGQLAGSCLSLDQAVHNVHRWNPQLPLQHLLHMCSHSAASVIGLAEEIGTIAPGKKADLVLLDPALQVVRTLRGGIDLGRQRSPTEG
jgi:N-acetylglucosamine-6-phosphate deacetylase